MIIWVIECIESEDVKMGLLLSWLLLSLFFILNTYICSIYYYCYDTIIIVSISIVCNNWLHIIIIIILVSYYLYINCSLIIFI